MTHDANINQGTRDSSQSESNNSTAAGFAVLGLETAINTALGLDASLEKAFSELEGNAIGLFCTEPHVSAVIFLGARCHILQSLEHDDPAISASLTGDSQAWLDLASADDKAAALINSELQLRGDSTLFQKIAQLIESIEIDWGSLAAERFGKVPTHVGASLLAALKTIGSDGKNKLTEQTQAYLQSDASSVVNSDDSKALYSALRSLELTIDRLEARVKKLGV